jgi:patatin-like phospholipase/acyl hydrolase
LCQGEIHPEVRVRIDPPTRGVGILCIDGGGVRGVIPLRIMKHIKDRIGLPIPIQKFFKIVYGISSGKLRLLLYNFH